MKWKYIKNKDVIVKYVFCLVSGMLAGMNVSKAGMNLSKVLINLSNFRSREKYFGTGRQTSTWN